MRTAVIAALIAAALATGAPAATITGTGRSERLVGTPRADLILGGGGRDVVEALGGRDGIAAQYDGARDVVRCGRGRDVVTADRVDSVAADCEVVSRLVSRDTYTTVDGQHETQVEPHALAAGSTIVATFQSGRRHAGGAADIGFSTSPDGGRTWQGGHLPALTVSSRPAGTADYASDPVVAYDAAHGVWLISTLAVSPGRLTELYISRSTDGLRWSPPVVAARFAGNSLAFDKNWAACDNWPQSPYRGRCYLAYTDHLTRAPRMAVQTSDDGGMTWSEAVIAVRAPETVGVLPLPRPDGSLVLPYLGDDEIQSVRSTDGGKTFEQPVTIAGYDHRPVEAIRSFPLPTADLDAQGRLYVAWQDCRFRAGCAANDVVLATSPDGLSWSVPARVTRDGGTDFVPALAVESATGRLALAYHRCTGSPCRTDVLVARSRDGGATWSSPQLVSAQPMRTAWLPTTTSGRMVGDYIAVPWARGRPVAVYSLASPPRSGGGFRQAIAAAPIP
jgi:hypothetical protein